MISGVDPSSVDFNYEINALSIVVGGLSAGLAMALAALGALMGAGCPEAVAAAGMILPDASVGPAGGLKAKLKLHPSLRPGYS